MAPPDISEQILLELAALRAFVDQSRGEVVQVIRVECSRLRDDLLDGRQNSARSFGLAVTDFIADDVAMREEELARIALEAARRKAAGLPGEGPLTARANSAFRALSEASSPSAAMYSPTAAVNFPMAGVDVPMAPVDNAMAPVYNPMAAIQDPSAAPQLIDALPSEPKLPLISDTVPGSMPEHPVAEQTPLGNEIKYEPELVHLEPQKAVVPTMPLLEDTSNVPRYDAKAAQSEVPVPDAPMMTVASLQSNASLQSMQSMQSMQSNASLQSNHHNNTAPQPDTSNAAPPMSRKNPFLTSRAQSWQEQEQARLQADARAQAQVQAGDGGAVSVVRASAPLLASSSPSGVGARSPVAGRTPSGMGARSPAIAPARSPAIPPARSPAIAPARSPVGYGARSPTGGMRTPSGVKSPSTLLIEQQRQDAFFADGQPRLWGDEEIKGWIRVTMRMSARFPEKKERTAFLWRRYEELKVHVVPEQQADMEELAHWLVRLVEDND